MEISRKPLNASQSPGNLSANGRQDAVQLLEKARADTDAVLKALGTQPSGLSETEADSRLKQFGTNEIAREKHQSARCASWAMSKIHWFFCSWRWVCFPF
jgi:Mg2+-importing ATPase